MQKLKAVLASIALLVAIIGVIVGFFNMSKGIEIIVGDIIISLFVAVLLRVLGDP